MSLRRAATDIGLGALLVGVSLVLFYFYQTHHQPWMRYTDAALRVIGAVWICWVIGKNFRSQS